MADPEGLGSLARAERDNGETSTVSFLVKICCVRQKFLTLTREGSLPELDRVTEFLYYGSCRGGTPRRKETMTRAEERVINLTALLEATEASRVGLREALLISLRKNRTLKAEVARLTALLEAKA